MRTGKCFLWKKVFSFLLFVAFALIRLLNTFLDIIVTRICVFTAFSDISINRKWQYFLARIYHTQISMHPINMNGREMAGEIKSGSVETEKK